MRSGGGHTLVWGGAHRRGPALRAGIVVAIVLSVIAVASIAGAQEIRSRAGTAGGDATGTSQATASEPFSFTKITLALGAVVGLIFVLKYGAGKVVPGAAGAKQTKAISVVSRLAVAPKQQLMLVKVGRRVVLVANTGTQMNALSEISDPDEVAHLMGQIESDKPSAPMVGAFNSLFKNHEEKFDPTRDDVTPDMIGERPGTAVTADVEDDEQVGAARQELNGLAERVRLISRNLNRS